MARKQFDFDHQYRDLEKKIEELRQLSRQTQFDLDEEIEELGKKMQSIREKKYLNLCPWEKILLSRHPDRPSPNDLIEMIFEDWMELHGDRCYGDDPAIVGGIASFDGQPVTVLGHRKGRNTSEKVKNNFGMPHPEGYRKVERLLAQAEKFNRPVITFVDTQGAYPGVGAEERGQAGAIAQVLMTLTGLKTPVLSVVTGEGGSGGALALAVSDRLLMLSNAIFSVASPEAAASILLKDQDKVEDMASALKLTAADLKDLGIAHEIILEPAGGAHRDPQGSADSIKAGLKRHLEELARLSQEQMLEERYQRFRNIGVFLE